MYIHVYYFEIIKTVIILCSLQHYIDSNFAFFPPIYVYNAITPEIKSLFQCSLCFLFQFKYQKGAKQQEVPLSIWSLHRLHLAVEFRTIGPAAQHQPFLPGTTSAHMFSGHPGGSWHILTRPLRDLQLNKVSQRWASEK